MKTVLFVCSGNTCRSPMAEAMFNDMVEDYPRLRELGVRAKSAGTYAADNAPMAPQAETVLKEMGISPKHRSTRFHSELAKEADLILTMQEQHLEEVDALAPETDGRAHTFLGYAQGVDGYTGSEEYDVEDPFHQPVEVYRECAEQMRAAIAKVMDRLEREW